MKSYMEQLYEDVGEKLNITSSDFLRKKDNAGLIRVLNGSI